MKQQDIIKVKTDKDDNLIVTMKITSIKPIIETLKKYDKDNTEDIFKIEYPYILKNTINEIIDAYEEKLISVIDNNRYADNESLKVTTSSSDIDDINNNPPYLEDITLKDIDNIIL